MIITIAAELLTEWLQDTSEFGADLKQLQHLNRSPAAGISFVISQGFDENNENVFY